MNEDTIERYIPKEPEVISKAVSLSFDGRHFLSRIPTEIRRFLEIEKGDKIEYNITIPLEMIDLPTDQIDKSKLIYTFRIIKGDSSG